MSQRNDVVHTPRKAKVKQAFRELVDEAGGQKTLADLTGRGQQRISFWGHANTDAFPPIDAIIDAEDLTRGRAGSPHVTRAMCALNGGVFVKLPDGAASATEYLKIIASLMKEGGEVSSALTWALSDDDDISRAEARKVLPEVHDLIAAAVGLAHRLEQVAE